MDRAREISAEICTQSTDEPRQSMHESMHQRAKTSRATITGELLKQADKTLYMSGTWNMMIHRAVSTWLSRSAQI